MYIIHSTYTDMCLVFMQQAPLTPGIHVVYIQNHTDSVNGLNNHIFHKLFLDKRLFSGYETVTCLLERFVLKHQLCENQLNHSWKYMYIQYDCIQTSFLSEECDTVGFSKSSLVFSLYSYIYWSLWCCEDGVVVK